MAEAKSEENTDELMLVTVQSDDVLNFHPEKLQDFFADMEDLEIPVVIIGIIGEPESNKTPVVNLIRHYNGMIADNSCNKDFDWVEKVWKDAKKRKTGAECASIKYGISVGPLNPRLILDKDSKHFTVLVLDIWCSKEETSSGVKGNVYNKLVDLCLYLSSVVVYMGFACAPSSKNQRNDYLWTPSKSEMFNHLDPESFQRLFILLQEWPFPGLHPFGKDVNKRWTKSFLNSNWDRLAYLEKIKGISNELKTKYREKNQECYLLPRCTDILFVDHLKTILENLFINDEGQITPVVRQGHCITIQNVQTLFLDGILMCNDRAISTHKVVNDQCRKLRPRAGRSGRSDNVVVDMHKQQNSNQDQEEEQHSNQCKQKQQHSNQDQQEQNSNRGQEEQQNSNQGNHEQQNSNQGNHEQQNSNHDEQKQQNSNQIQNEESVLPEKASTALSKSNVLTENYHLKNIVENYGTEMKNKFSNGLSIEKLYYDERELQKLHNDSFEMIIIDAQDKSCIEINARIRKKLEEEAIKIYNKISSDNATRKKRYDNLKMNGNKIVQFMLKYLSDKLSKEIRRKSNNQICEETKQFLDQEMSKLINKLEYPWSVYFDGKFDKKKTKIMSAVLSLLIGVTSYEEKLTERLNQFLCVTENQFHEIDADVHRIIMSENPRPQIEAFNDIMSRQTDSIRTYFFEENLAKLGLENKMVKDAMDFIVNEYHKFMTFQVTPSRILTDKQIQELHSKACNSLINGCFRIPEFKYTPSWGSCHHDLYKIFTDGTLLDQYIRANQLNIKNLKIKRKKALASAEELYLRKMNYFLRVARLNKSRLNFFHGSSMEQGAHLYLDHMGSDGSANWGRWKEILGLKLASLYDVVLEENRITPESIPEDISIEDDFEEQIPNENFGVGIYFGPNFVMGSVFKEGDRLKDFFSRTENLRLSPFIAFMNETICFGEEAERMDNNVQLNVYEMLSCASNFHRPVEIYGESFGLKLEEILALFLHHVKLELENKCGLNSPITSCVLASSPFLSGVSKRILKNSLTLAGFQNSTLIHSTTATGIYYQLTRTIESYTEDVPALVVHEAPGIFDVAVISISKTTGIKVKSICGLPNVPELEKSWWSYLRREPTPAEIRSKQLKNLIRDTLKQGKLPTHRTYTLHAILIVAEVASFEAETAIKEVVHRDKFTITNENNGILAGASVLSLHLNEKREISNVGRSLKYEERTPFVLCLDDSSSASVKVIKSKNAPITELKQQFSFKVPSERNYKITIAERKENGDSTFYEVSAVKTEKASHKNINIHLTVSGSDQGVFYVTLHVNGGEDGDLSLSVCRSYMSEAELNESMKTLARIFPRNMRIQRKNTPTVSSESKMMTQELSQQSSSTCSSSTDGPSNESSLKARAPSPAQKKRKDSDEKGNSDIDDARSKLIKCMEKVREKIEGGRATTNPLIIQRIEQLMVESQKMLDSDKTSKASLEVQIQKLEMGTARIKV